MYQYRAYGLTIHSEIQLPELISHSTLQSPEVVIRRKHLTDSPLDRTAPHAYCLTASGLYLYWETVGTFLITLDDQIWIDPDPNADDARLRLFIVGAALGVILHHRGLFVLHASAVVVDGQAVAFMGNKGFGKSTLAATLHKRGHSVLGDDVIAIDLSVPGHPMVIPAFPQLKLWPDAVEAVCDRTEDTLPLVHDSIKRQLQFHEEFQLQPIPLRQLFVLGRGDEIEIAALSLQDQIQALIANTYVTRFQDELLQGESRQTHFRRLTTLIQQVAIARLLRPADLGRLDEVAAIVEASLRSPESPPHPQGLAVGQV